MRLALSPARAAHLCASAGKRGSMATYTASTPPSPPREVAPPVPARALAQPVETAGGGGPTPTIRLCVIGDVHGSWGPEDDAALTFLDPTAALFVGDFGEEDTGLVERLMSNGGQNDAVASSSAPPRLFVLGNHDAWFCLTRRGQDRAVRKGKAEASPVPGVVSPGVKAQLAALGPSHVGWGHAAVTASSPTSAPASLVVAGGRPFSKGGHQWSDVAVFYEAYAGVANPGEAAEKTVGVLREAAAAAAAAGARAGMPLPLVLLAHNGPAGLGSRSHDPCGADFLAQGGDWGDPDLAAALDAVAGRGEKDKEGESGLSPSSSSFTPPAAVLFGHMHRNLKGGGTRDAVRFEDEGRRGRTGTVFLNAAVTPRRRAVPGAAPGSVACHFLIVELTAGRVSAASDVWVGVTGEACVPLLEKPLVVSDGKDRWGWQAHSGAWVREGE